MTKEETLQAIEKEINTHHVVLYMKGTKERPACGFSSRVVAALNALKMDYTTHNVLDDPLLREAIKEFSNWPTLPQLYIDASFIGGCDIVMQLYEEGELQNLLTPLKSDV